ncbi:uncharacterized protein A4U43_C03F2110 [Asparagus officinalis]|uniref:C2 domain-containing protein n=1 Tax=Asparagus officinalis TaxID=4686 RepID=A0A5P1F7D3_ASPOF|nr:uncharacterized protein LOC109832037 [Asparagus officinalis]ONK74034.1 uncharacterized protein A4U43_C03F2110 [Asparagus officinalis]
MAQLRCEMNIMKLTNLDTSPTSGKLFIRYYVYVGGGRRVRIDTREVPSAGEDPHWGEESSLECAVPSNPVKKAIRERGVLFELRWRRDESCFGMKAKSKMLGRAEAAWEDALVEKRVSFAMRSPLTVTEGCKPPTLLVRMGIKVRDLELREKHKGCDCEGCGWIGSEEDMFVAATAATIYD